MRHLAACERLIRAKGKVDMNMALCMMNGPPRVGKSTFLLRITGRPLPQYDGASETASTGVAERIFQVAIKKSSFTVAMAQAPRTAVNWQVITLSQEVAVILRAILSSQPTFETQEIPTSASAGHQLQPILSPCSEELSTNGTTTSSEAETNRQPVAMAVPEDTKSRLRIFHMSQRKKLSRTPEYQAYLEVLKRSLRSKEWETAEQLLKQSLTLYFHDVGGQPEFQEVLPAIIAGPCIFFVVFKLTDRLQQKYRVQYVESLTRKSITYESSFTVLESILQSLASIASMCSYVSRNNGELLPVKPKVVLVGTHKDKAKEKQIKDIQREMKQVLLDTEFFRNNIVVFASEDEPVLTINSLSQDDQDVSTIRQLVEGLAKDPAFTVSVPAPWLALLLSFRLQSRAVISYEECTQMANECGIYGDKDIKEALWFLQTKLGVIRYFHQIPELSEIVICDPQVIFDKITELITRTFTFEQTRNACVSKEFTQKGIFPFEVIDMISHHSNELLTGSRLVILLKHLRIIAPIYKQPQQSPSHYLVPCVLVHAPVKTIIQKITTFVKGKNRIPSLCITFRCGYCPKGMFGALIAELMNHGSQWRFLDDAIYRDQVSFSFGPEGHVVKISFQVTFLEVHISATTSHAKSEQRNNAKHVCSTIRLALEKSLVNVSTALHYGSGAGFQFGFYCTSCKQPAMCDHDDPVVMRCNNCKDVDLKANHRLWFDEKLEPSDGLCINHLEIVLRATWEARVKWYNIGLGLKIDPGTLNAINENSSNVEDRFRNMLEMWLKMSQPKPTILLLTESLKSPIVGYEHLAERLTSLL